MASTNSYDYRTTFRVIGKNDSNGVPLTVADGDNNVFVFPGTDSMASEVGPVARTIAAITDECFNKPAENRVAGASGTLFQGCPIVAPEFLAQFAFGYAAEYSPTGQTYLATASAENSDNCFVCDPNDESNQTWWMLEGICKVDCDNKVVGRSLNVVRAISQAELSRQLRKGGTTVSALGADLNVTLDDNDGFGLGPGEVVESFEIDGLTPGSNPQVCVDLPANVDLTAFEEAMCACAQDYFGCAVTAAILGANPELDVPFITGVPAP